MTCFWTDLVGTTQNCEVSGLRFAVRKLALMGETAPALSEAVALYQANADVGTMLFYPYITGDGVGEAGNATEARNITTALDDGIFLFANANYTDTSISFPAGFVASADKFDVAVDGFGSPIYDELVVSASLSVVADVIVNEQKCGNTNNTVNTLSGSAYTISVSSPGVLLLTVVSDFTGGSGAIVGVRALRVQGTVTGENGTTATVDFWATGYYDGCF